MKFNLKNFKTFFLLFFTEVIISQTSGFVRHTVGDFLVVILLYFLVKSFFDIPSKKIGIAVLIFVFLIEFLQLTNLIQLLGLQNNKLANIFLGNTFSIGDLVAYLFSVITVIYTDKQISYETIK